MLFPQREKKKTLEPDENFQFSKPFALFVTMKEDRNIKL